MRMFAISNNTIFSIDSQLGTGDHENYFHKAEKVLDMDGVKVFSVCTKIAATVRTMNVHTPWHSNGFTFLFSKESKFYYRGQEITIEEIKTSETDEVASEIEYTRALNPVYGYVSQVFSFK